MKKGTYYVLIISFALFICNAHNAACDHYYPDEVCQDTLRHDGSKKLKREEEKQTLRNSHQRAIIKVGYVYANLNTKLTFELPNDILNANLGLENNLGLPDKSFFFTGSFIYRFSPQSGLYMQYYGINRGSEHQTQQEYIFGEDTIPAGINGKVFFNTQVISTGYLLSVLRDPDAFFGVYFNVYLMMLSTGIKSDIGNVNANLKLNAPLPNFGLVAKFKLNKWLYLDGNVGFFSLSTKTIGGTLYDLNISLLFKPARWLGLAMSYQEFDIQVYFPSGEINSIVEYNFKGPSLGAIFSF